MFRVLVTYRLKALDDMSTIDKGIRRSVGKGPVGTGYNVFNKLRELDFEFRDKKKAVAAAKLLTTTHARVKVTVEGQVWP